MRVAYFYPMNDEPDRVRAVAPRHAAYRREPGLPGHLGGAFADRSGGLITIQADSMEAAEKLATGDPFVVEDLRAARWLMDRASYE